MQNRTTCVRLGDFRHPVVAASKVFSSDSHNENDLIRLAPTRRHRGCSAATPILDASPHPGRYLYFVTIRRVGVTVLVGAIGEIEKVNQVFHPDGRFSAANSPYALKFR